MVKTPRTRHSGKEKDPVTIDLQPGEVSRVKAEAEKAAEAPAPSPAGGSSAPAGTDTSRPEATSGDASKPSQATKPAGSSETAASSDRPASGAAASATASSASALKPSPGGGSGAGSSSFGRQEPGATPKPSPRPAEASAAPRTNGLLAGVAGGVIALLLGGGLQLAGLLPAPNGGGQDETARVTALETEIAALRDQIAGFEQSTPDAALDGRVAQAEERLSSLSTGLDTLRGEVTELREAGGGAPADTGPLEERIAALETAIADQGGGAASEAALAALDAQIATLRGEIDSARNDITSAREAQTAASERVAALEQALGGVSQRLDEQAEAPATGTIIAASALKAAIDRGTPFMTELETFATLAPDAPEIAELRGLAAAGVPTRAEIASETDAAANAMIAAARPVDPNAGIVDRLWDSARGLVQVRPIGMVEGEGVPEIVARMDAAIKANDYDRALAEYEALPAAARSAGEAFAARLRARAAADRLIDQALAAALKP